jgi:hypothetical protein
MTSINRTSHAQPAPTPKAAPPKATPTAPAVAPALPPQERDRIAASIKAATPGNPYYEYKDGKIYNALVVDLPDASPEAVFARLKQGDWPKFWPNAAMSAVHADEHDGHVARFDFHPNANAPKEQQLSIHERVRESERLGPDGKPAYRLDVELSRDFQGHGHYEVTRLPGGGARIVAAWDGVTPPKALDPKILAKGGGFDHAHLQPMQDAFTALNAQLKATPKATLQELEARADDSFAELERLHP